MFPECSRTREKCRQIDVVTVKGSTLPMGLYTYDVDLTKMDLDMGDPRYRPSLSFFPSSLIINMLMPAPMIVLHIQESYWYSKHRGIVARSS
jgi:hypothetical protein